MIANGEYYHDNMVNDMKLNRWSKNDTIARILEAMRREKLLNKGNCMLFIDSRSIKASPEANKNRDNQEQNFGCSRWF